MGGRLRRARSATDDEEHDMGIMDKARTQAQQLAQKAQDGAKGAQGKLEDVQAKRRADALLRDLGAWHHAQHEGRDNGRAGGQIARLLGELRAHETEHGALVVPSEPGGPDPSPAAPPSPSAPPPAAATTEPSAAPTTGASTTGATEAGALRTPVEGRP
jgi:hypothetical protein